MSLPQAAPGYFPSHLVDAFRQYDDVGGNYVLLALYELCGFSPAFVKMRLDMLYPDKLAACNCGFCQYQRNK